MIWWCHINKFISLAICYSHFEIMQVAELLSNSLQRNNSNITVFDLGSFKTSPEKNLKDAKVSVLML